MKEYGNSLWWHIVYLCPVLIHGWPPVVRQKQERLLLKNIFGIMSLFHSTGNSLIEILGCSDKSPGRLQAVLEAHCTFYTGFWRGAGWIEALTTPSNTAMMALQQMFQHQLKYFFGNRLIFQNTNSSNGHLRNISQVRILLEYDCSKTIVPRPLLQDDRMKAPLQIGWKYTSAIHRISCRVLRKTN